jgi:hypothetical protein
MERVTRAGLRLAHLVLVLAGTTACLTPSLSDQVAYGKLVSDGVVTTPIPHKSKGLAMTLNFVVPGTGHVYLEEFSAALGIFVCNVGWPLSIALGVQAAREDTDVVNQRYTVNYYLYGPGRPQRERAETARASELALKYLDAQFRAGRAEVEQREVTDMLLRAGFAPAPVAALDWRALETTSSIRILTQPLPPAVGAGP